MVRSTKHLPGLEPAVHAALVTAFDRPPSYVEVPDPCAGAGEVVVDVLAAALHPRVRSQADGSHYTSTGALPLVPGIDAVVRDPEGVLRYALLDDTALGTMADRTAIELARSVVLPAGTDSTLVAAVMNPAMSSWVALRRRVELRPGQRVLVIGATGSSGRVAIQVARRFGASQVIAAGRDATRLAPLLALGADQVCALDQLDRAADVDVVVDYVWGEATAAAMAQVVRARPDRSAPLTWIEVGSVAGPDAAIPSAALRAARLTIVGSGIGSVPGSDYVAELPAIAEAAADGAFAITVRAVPLADVEAAWTAPADPDVRTVLVP